MGENPRIEELRRRVQADPASIAFASLAEEYRRVGRFEDAIETCLAGLKRHPSYLSAHVTLGRAYLETSRYEEAQGELELVLRSAPENLAAIRGLAEIHQRRGEGAYAQRPATAAVEAVPAPPAPVTHEAVLPAVEVPAAIEPPSPVEEASVFEPDFTGHEIAALERFLVAIQSARTTASAHAR